jgi:hypothetical protein
MSKHSHTYTQTTQNTYLLWISVWVDMLRYEVFPREKGFYFLQEGNLNCLWMSPGQQKDKSSLWLFFFSRLQVSPISRPQNVFLSLVHMELQLLDHNQGLNSHDSKREQRNLSTHYCWSIVRGVKTKVKVALSQKTWKKKSGQLFGNEGQMIKEAQLLRKRLHLASAAV